MDFETSAFLHDLRMHSLQREALVARAIDSVAGQRAQAGLVNRRDAITWLLQELRPLRAKSDQVYDVIDILERELRCYSGA